MLRNSSSSEKKRPIIGCTTYRKISQDTNVPLFGLMPTYTESVLAAGGIPLLIPLGLSEADLLAILERIDGLILPGGGDIDPSFYQGAAHVAVGGVDEDRDRVELFLARQAIRQAKPLLAICRGHQVLNVALGGTVWADIGSQVPEAIRHDYFGRIYPRNHLPHTVNVRAGSQLAAILGQGDIWVNSFHHQGIEQLAAGLRATAVAPDGLIEGVEVTGHPFAIGVQWHPECLIHDDPAMLNLFVALVKASLNGDG